MDKSQGFWVIHSVPLFPPFPEDGYGYPASGQSYGQTAICITFKYDQFTEIGMESFFPRMPLLHCTSLTSFLWVVPPKLIALVLHCHIWKPSGAWKPHPWLSVLFIQQFPVGMWEIHSSTLPPSPHEDYWDNNSHKSILRVKSAHAYHVLWKYKGGW